ncbi:MAG: hypothetical protein ACOY0R_10090 [Chloroflexota bacterium]
MTSNLPFRVTLLAWLVLSLTVWNGFRLWTAIAWRDVLGEFASRPGALYIGATGLFWMLLGWLDLWAILRAKSWWTPRLLAASAAGYTAWYWADRLLLQTGRDNWPFTLIVNLLLLGWTWFALRTNIFAKERNT